MPFCLLSLSPGTVGPGPLAFWQSAENVQAGWGAPSPPGWGWSGAPGREEVPCLTQAWAGLWAPLAGVGLSARGRLGRGRRAETPGLGTECVPATQERGCG